MAAASTAPAPAPAPVVQTDHTDVARPAVELFPWLPCQVTLEIPVAHFTVRDLLGLQKGSMVQTKFKISADVPLRVNKVLLGWVQFEALEERLAVRVTELE